LGGVENLARTIALRPRQRYRYARLLLLLATLLPAFPDQVAASLGFHSDEQQIPGAGMTERKARATATAKARAKVNARATADPWLSSGGQLKCDEFRKHL
jgi:hypothetical protein